MTRMGRSLKMAFAQPRFKAIAFGLLATASINLAACSGGGGNTPISVMATPSNMTWVSPSPIPSFTTSPAPSAPSSPPAPATSATPTISATVAPPTATPTGSALPTPTATPISGTAYHNGVLIPLYTYPNPTTVWDNLIALKGQHPRVPIYIIANDSSGISTKADPHYQSIIAKCRAAGIKVIMYVDSNYATRSLTAVKSDIANQVSFYGPINGIFIDQMSNASGNESFYSSLTSYAHSLGAPFVIGNPGVDPLQSYVGTVDNIVASETTTYPPFSTISTQKYVSAGQNAWSIIANATTFDSNMEAQEKPYIGFIYATTDNTYGALSNDLPNQLNYLDSF